MKPGSIHKPVTESNAFLISPNAGTSNFAGKQCNPNFFVTSYQNDQIHEVLGKYAKDKGYKSAFLLAPNYQAGKDALAGFKRDFKGEIVDEGYAPLGRLDFSAELAKIAADKREDFFTFMPSGMGVNLVKQYRQARLASSPPLQPKRASSPPPRRAEDATAGRSPRSSGSSLASPSGAAITPTSSPAGSNRCSPLAAR
jgi:ABC-type branched-subunit amino acid transport system substrate-binding protein